MISSATAVPRDYGYELRGGDAESVGSVCMHNNHENPDGCEVMSRDMHTSREARGSLVRDCNHLWRADPTPEGDRGK
jgi:hypothetical protein